MRSNLTHEQIEDLLINVIGTDTKDWKGDKIQFCCPVHGEQHASCGINADFCPDGEPNLHAQTFHCFSCHAKGSLPWLLYQSLPDRFRSLKQAEEFMKDRYGVTFNLHFDENTGEISRYEDQFQKVPLTRKKIILPRSKLAPFKSGKETYQYFYDRGFDKEDVKEYMVGRDLDEETVTMPVFWEDKQLAGVIGRFIDPNRPKNMRFRIYDFQKSKLIFPLDKVQTVNDTLIGVESQIDCMMMRKWGYTNCISTFTNSVSKEQAKQIISRCSKFIGLWDNDEGGEKAHKIAKDLLGDEVLYLRPTYYPEYGKDPSEWGREETEKVIKSAKALITRTIPRLE